MGIRDKKRNSNQKRLNVYTFFYIKNHFIRDLRLISVILVLDKKKSCIYLTVFNFISLSYPEFAKLFLLILKYICSSSIYFQILKYIFSKNMLYFQNNMFSQIYSLFLGQAGQNYRLFDTSTFEGFRKRKKKEEKASQIDFTYVMFCTI